MNRVLVYGGRGYGDGAAVFADLDREHAETGIDLIIEGGAPGADQFGGHWARKREVPCLRIPARWRAFGEAAGPMRNAVVVSLGQPTQAFEYPGGRGTADMRGKLERAGVVIVKCPRPAVIVPPLQSDLFG